MCKKNSQISWSLARQGWTIISDWNCARKFIYSKLQIVCISNCFFLEILQFRQCSLAHKIKTARTKQDVRIIVTIFFFFFYSKLKILLINQSLQPSSLAISSIFLFFNFAVSFFSTFEVISFFTRQKVIKYLFRADC